MDQKKHWGEKQQFCLKVVILQPDAERLRHFDQLVVLSNGRLVESGTPEEVMTSQERSAGVRPGTQHVATVRNSCLICL